MSLAAAGGAPGRHAALQQNQGTIRALNPGAVIESKVNARPAAAIAAETSGMTISSPKEFFIQGVTLEGKTFRPSDWSERLAGVMSSFRPGGANMRRTAHFGYSPFCVPRVINGVKCVIVNERLREIEPMAWDFVMGFAEDNRLQVVEACLIEPAPTTTERPLRR